jgi:hypothetical protein
VWGFVGAKADIAGVRRSRSNFLRELDQAPVHCVFFEGCAGRLWGHPAGPTGAWHEAGSPPPPLTQRRHGRYVPADRSSAARLGRLLRWGAMTDRRSKPLLRLQHCVRRQPFERLRVRCNDAECEATAELVQKAN